MGPQNKDLIRRAAIRLSQDNHAQITQVTDVRKRDESAKFSDRVAAAAAAFFVCGATYFVVWILVIVIDAHIRPAAEIAGIGNDVEATWKFPLYATALTSLFGFFSPSLALEFFGAVMEWARKLLPRNLQ